MKDIVVVCGPTCTGKTKYAIEIAKAFDGEVVSCDSMQIYKGMDIGSAKPSKEEINAVPHHLIGVIDPTEKFSVARYQEMARNEIDNIQSRNRLPILAGGTGLYINSVIYDMDFAVNPADNSLREELSTLGNDELHKVLESVDPDAAERIHPNNRKKAIRAIEAAKSGGRVEDFSNSFKRNEEYNPHMIALTMDREVLYDRINTRVEQMFERGLIDEVRGLMETGLTYDDISMKGIGYKEVIEYLEGKTDYDTAVDNVKKNTRHYAKRQFTWLKQYQDLEYFDVTDKDRTEEIISWLRKRL